MAFFLGAFVTAGDSRVTLSAAATAAGKSILKGCAFKIVALPASTKAPNNTIRVEPVGAGEHPDGVVAISNSFYSTDLTPDTDDGRGVLFARSGPAAVLFGENVTIPAAGWVPVKVINASGEFGKAASGELACAVLRVPATSGEPQWVFPSATPFVAP